MPAAIRAVVGSLGAAAWHRPVAQRGDERGADRRATRGTGTSPAIALSQ